MVFCKTICDVCENEFEFENPRRNPQILAVTPLMLTGQNFLLTEQKLCLPEHCSLFNGIPLKKPICLETNFRTHTLDLLVPYIHT